ncbi:LOW QUALITY PROTEIN: CHY zinc finger domain protein [Purpureocillium lavendulum]|uniref:CHY zinc finger domain protein n=1 Tax=Purpureocillium lavendulum TaxID=1247861 RepID=A0AB34FFS4_9HYPO|nr:LOW QUALITY PROTEIN: CHY zinc finger domain protein [Purpureocillium lavendulum]
MSPGRTAQVVAEPSASRVVPRPVPESQAQDPRGYQLAQLRRRFSPRETTVDGTTSLIFKLVPSDPDFPFELAHLECELRVPEDYRKRGPNCADMPRGFAINIERGWAQLAENQKSTLLALVNALDKNLEKFLSEQKVETVKLVPVKDTRHLTGQNQAQTETQTQAPHAKPKLPQYVPEPSYTKEQTAEAKARRAQEVRQLEARMGGCPGSVDLPTVSCLPSRLSLVAVTNFRPVYTRLHLIVPLLYPLQDLRLQLNEADAEDAEPVEDLFVERAASQKSMSLMSHVNYLAQNLHTLDRQARQAKQARIEAEREAAAKAKAQAEAVKEAEMPKAQAEASHIRVIPRPPEWDISDEDTDESSDDGGAAIDPESLEPLETSTDNPTETPERGTMISFPSIELHGIEVLQVSVLNLTVKCERCRTSNDMTGLKPGVEKKGSCKKCATQMTAVFRQQLVHQNSTRAGFIDLSGCRVADMLPSTFVPTCSRCSAPCQGLVSVRGETTTNVCRECHGRFTFKVPEVKFLFISPGSKAPPTMGPRRKMEKLGIHAGEPLPDRGTCAHYRKSFRWFRFSCCSRVHACDRCHDAAEDHINEWANRMICGFCSREQNYAVDACTYCGRSVIGKRGRGFWEGGRGTRDRATMSRKDPRKYKRLGPG